MARYRWQNSLAKRFTPLSDVLEERAKSLWPELSIEAVFLPLGDRTLGDISSEFTQQIASEIKLPIGEVTSKLLSGLGDIGPYYLCVYDGYLNIRIPNHLTDSFSANLSRPRNSTLVPFINIVLPPPTTELNSWPYIRLCALALHHFRLLIGSGFTASLYIDREVVAAEGHVSIKAFWAYILDLIEKPYRLEKEVYDDLSKFWEEKREGALYVWAGREVWRRRDLESLRRIRDLIFHFPPRSWFNGEDIVKPITILSQFSEAQLLALELYLSSALTYSEIDLSVLTGPLAQGERANLLWYGNATLRRLGNIIAEVFGASSAEHTALAKARGKNSDWEMPRALSVRLACLEWLFGSLALKGEVITLNSAYFDTLDLVNSCLNSPNFRGRLSRGATWEGFGILKKAHSQLSLIQSKYKLFGLDGN